MLVSEYLGGDSTGRDVQARTEMGAPICGPPEDPLVAAIGGAPMGGSGNGPPPTRIGGPATPEPDPEEMVEPEPVEPEPVEAFEPSSFK